MGCRVWLGMTARAIRHRRSRGSLPRLRRTRAGSKSHLTKNDLTPSLSSRRGNKDSSPKRGGLRRGQRLKRPAFSKARLGRRHTIDTELLVHRRLGGWSHCGYNSQGVVVGKRISLNAVESIGTAGSPKVEISSRVVIPDSHAKRRPGPSMLVSNHSI